MNAQINKYIDEHVSEMVATLSRLVAVPSVKSKPAPDMPYGEECAKVLDEMLKTADSFGFVTENYSNRVGTIDFYSALPPTLGVLCHLDVVPAGNGWKTPPFTLYMENGKLYGRGSTDDKGPAVCVLYAMKAIRDLKIPLSKNVRFIVGTDEENGSSDLAWYKARHKLPPFVFTPDGSYPVINIEKGMIRGEISADCKCEAQKTILSVNGGTVINAVPEKATATVAGFSELELKLAAQNTGAPNMFSFSADENKTVIVASGKSAHASTPAEGKNAITALCNLLGRLHSDDNTSRMFASLSHLFPFGETDGASLKIKVSDETSGALTEVLSIINFNGSKLFGKFDIRFPVCSSCDKLRTKLEKAFSQKGFTLSNFSGSEPHMVDENSPFIKTLISVYEEATGSRGGCIAIGGGTYVHEIDGGVAFGAEFIGEDNHIHSANEFMSIERMKQNAKIFAEAIIRICK